MLLASPPLLLAVRAILRQALRCEGSDGGMAAQPAGRVLTWVRGTVRWFLHGNEHRESQWIMCCMIAVPCHTSSSAARST